MIVDDPDAPYAAFTHWLIWNIPPTDVIPRAIAKKATIKEPFIAVQGKNDWMLDLPAGDSLADLEKAMQGHVLQKGEAMATYRR